jgi:hypothetical protein
VKKPTLKSSIYKNSRINWTRILIILSLLLFAIIIGGLIYVLPKFSFFDSLTANDLVRILEALVGMIVAVVAALGAQMIVRYLDVSSPRLELKLKADLESAFLEAQRAKLEALKADRVSSEAGSFEFISSEEKIELINTAISRISTEAIDKLRGHFEQKYTDSLIKSQNIEVIQEIFTSINSRLYEEVEALQRRANINLVIGIVISLFGIFILWWYAVVTLETVPGAGENSDSLVSKIGSLPSRLLMRISLAIVVQFFAYFFLRLYRYALFEIKFFQNEITAVELRSAALQSAISVGDKQTISHVIKLLASSERNTILRKGETTINLRKDEIESIIDRDLSTSLKSVLSKLSLKDENR